MELFDTHAHLDDPQLAGQIEPVLARAAAAQVRQILTVGTSASSSQAAVELARRYPQVLAAVGIQPNDAAQAVQGDWDRIVQLARSRQASAIGETGLDRHWDFTPFALQQDYFDRHLQLAQETGLPVVIHMRDCDADMLAMLQQAAARGPLRGVMHSFTGQAATAHACIALGLHISFAGMVTYKRSDELRGIAADVPADRLLIETDSPYLSPHPVRKQRPNEPALIVHTAQCLADVRGMPLEALAELTTSNARRLLV